MNFPSTLICLELWILTAEVLITGAVHSAPPPLEATACVGCCSRVGIRNPDGDAEQSIMTLHSISNYDPEANEEEDSEKLALFACQVLRIRNGCPPLCGFSNVWNTMKRPI